MNKILIIVIEKFPSDCYYLYSILKKEEREKRRIERRQEKDICPIRGIA